MSTTKSINIQNLPEDIGLDLDHFVALYKTTKKQYAIDAIRNYNILQREVEAFRKANPGKRFKIRLEISPIEKSDDNTQKAAVLVY